MWVGVLGLVEEPQQKKQLVGVVAAKANGKKLKRICYDFGEADQAAVNPNGAFAPALLLLVEKTKTPHPQLISAYLFLPEDYFAEKVRNIIASDLECASATAATTHALSGIFYQFQICNRHWSVSSAENSKSFQSGLLEKTFEPLETQVTRLYGFFFVKSVLVIGTTYNRCDN